jgi:hypothetical protein
MDNYFIEIAIHEFQNLGGLQKNENLIKKYV